MSVVYLYEPSQARLVIHHYLEGTTDQVHADDVYTDYQFGDTYPMPKHSSPNYYLPSELSGDYTDYYEWNGVLPTNYQGTFNAESIFVFNAISFIQLSNLSYFSRLKK